MFVKITLKNINFSRLLNGVQLEYEYICNINTFILDRKCIEKCQNILDIQFQTYEANVKCRAIK